MSVLAAGPAGTTARAVEPTVEAMAAGPAGTTAMAVGPTVGCSSGRRQRSRERHMMEQHGRCESAGEA